MRQAVSSEAGLSPCCFTITSQSHWTPISSRCKLLIRQRGEMSEWLKEHAWKSTPPARADALQNAPTHLRINDFRNCDTRRRVPVNHCVDRGFRGVCDPVVTQNRF